MTETEIKVPLWLRAAWPFLIGTRVILFFALVYVASVFVTDYMEANAADRDTTSTHELNELNVRALAKEKVKVNYRSRREGEVVIEKICIDGRIYLMFFTDGMRARGLSVVRHHDENTSC